MKTLSGCRGHMSGPWRYGWVAAWLLTACSSSGPSGSLDDGSAVRASRPQPSGPSTAQVVGEASAALASNVPAKRHYGAAFAADVPEVTLGDLLAAPETYSGRRVQMQGEVARVCQVRGCWMELKESGGERTVRVPMAGHAFFLPRDVVGMSATVQGDIIVKSLTTEQQAHYRSEGMEAVGQAVSLHASGVHVGGS